MGDGVDRRAEAGAELIEDRYPYMLERSGLSPTLLRLWIGEALAAADAMDDRDRPDYAGAMVAGADVLSKHLAAALEQVRQVEARVVLAAGAVEALEAIRDDSFDRTFHKTPGDLAAYVLRSLTADAGQCPNVLPGEHVLGTSEACEFCAEHRDVFLCPTCARPPSSPSEGCDYHVVNVRGCLECDRIWRRNNASEATE